MYPVIDRTERLADGAVHAVGVIGAVTGVSLLLRQHAYDVSYTQLTALLIYGLALMATFVASAVYHLAPWHHLRPALRRVDHAAIYLKIAGTYTPIAVAVGNSIAYICLLAVWTFATLGMVAKLFFWQVPGRFCAVPFVALGWMGVLLIWSVWSHLPAETVTFAVAGGLTCTLGVIFFQSEKPFSTAIWHSCVVVASACFWAAIMAGGVGLA